MPDRPTLLSSSRTRTPFPRGALVVLTLVSTWLLVSCRVETTLAVDVEADGSGTVTVTVELDREAATELGPLEGVALSDLEEAGWQVEEPVSGSGSGLRVSARRAFSSPEDLADVLAEVGGGEDAPGGGVFRDVSLDVDPGLDRTSYRFSARVVLSGDPNQFSDDELSAALGGLPLGRTPEELPRLGADDPSAATLTLRVDLPGTEPSTDGVVVDGAAQWEFPLTGGEPTDQTVTVASQNVARGATALYLTAAVLALAAVTALVVALVHRR